MVPLIQDDECMFFSPTILNLRRSSTVHLLCLSTGNYYKQGSIRREELLSSCTILGIPPERVTVINHGDLPDDPKTDWDTQITGQLITECIKHNQIQVVITFDSYGVSGHTNHIGIFNAIKRLRNEGIPGDVSYYVLTSVNILRKYISLLDLVLSVSSRQMFLLSPHDMIVAQKAMYAHKSQLLWFRRLYIIFSRFMLINTLEELK
ncbi:N-acetylglucosaminyl-phosphatidylinositol de-N-acetylase-like isoform X2 [Stylophora pistillata]|uniref:N-acetylglucosaminyl-phosphatidylinositol de-N-acetylase-like isoform X2 n=1 Tax=Stylophora pistillata TaxID=50429 RepID=UPI000C046FE4|nr:N-acetylglucosaminyl-phosphatidylinositol de-N-acetylase-like isoform X2 [Stylophora pistillata]